MSEEHTPFPVDVDADPSSRPWNWRPVGYLVVILKDVDVAKQAAATLADKGFKPADVKLYTSAEMLANHETYMARRSATSKAVGAVIDDDEARQLYLGYARDDRCAMWARIPTKPMPTRRFGHSPASTGSTRATTERRRSKTSTSPIDGNGRQHGADQNR